MSLNEELLDASKKGDVEKVKKLLKEGADVNAKDRFGFTPLHYTALNGHFEVVKLLIERGADVNAKTNGGWTPLRFAAIYGHFEVVKLLIERGADVNAKDKDGGLPYTVQLFMVMLKLLGYYLSMVQIQTLKIFGVKLQ
jgi:ankyrin repeat protein